MKNIFDYYLKYTVISVFLLSSIISYAQNKSIFSARSQENQIRQIYTTFTASDTVSLEGLGLIYALSVDATIYQPREASFIRIVLEDIHGHDYLVAESDWSRNDTTIVHLDHYCEETAMLEGVVPVRIKCFLAGNAHLSIKSLHYSTLPPSRNTNDLLITAQDIRKSQVEDIIDRINDYNCKRRKLWRAGITSKNILDYDSREKLFGNVDDSYTANLIYYIEGLYELGEESSSSNPERTLCVDSFDWRYRHGKDYWITPPKNQGNSGYCTAFSAVALTEAMTNLYFNNNVNLDLSEQDVAYYSGVSYSHGASIDVPLNYIKNNGVIDESTLPFQDTPTPNMPTLRPEGLEKVSFDSIVLGPTIQEDNIELMKQAIIHNGPAVSGFWCPNGGSNYMNHAMTLTGYGKVTPEVMYTFVYTWSVDTIIHVGDWRIGKTYWIMKDSYYGTYDHGHNGYIYLIVNDYSYLHQFRFITPVIHRRGHTDAEIICEDIDRDGLFTWGLGNKPAHCPAWAPDYPDGDDSDRTKGLMNEYGYYENLSINSPMYDYISNDSILTIAENRTNYLGIFRGASVTVQAQQSFSNGTKLLLDNGATLILDGVVINGSSIQAYAGSKIILNNNARIIKPFNLPKGAQLIINRGLIE